MDAEQAQLHWYKSTLLQCKSVHPYFINGNLNIQKDLVLPNTTLKSTVTQLFEDENNQDEGHLILQQDEVPPYCSAPGPQF